MFPLLFQFPQMEIFSQEKFENILYQKFIQIKLLVFNICVRLYLYNQ